MTGCDRRGCWLAPSAPGFRLSLGRSSGSSLEYVLAPLYKNPSPQCLSTSPTPHRVSLSSPRRRARRPLFPSRDVGSQIVQTRRPQPPPQCPHHPHRRTRPLLLGRPGCPHTQEDKSLELRRRGREGRQERGHRPLRRSVSELDMSSRSSDVSPLSRVQVSVCVVFQRLLSKPSPAGKTSKTSPPCRITLVRKTSALVCAVLSGVRSDGGPNAYPLPVRLVQSGQLEKLMISYLGG